MFRKLRNKLILINLGITSVVIIAVFTGIYLVSTRSASSRPPIPEEILVQTSSTAYGDEVEKIITFTVREEKQAAAQNLLVMLIVSGILIEIAVAFVSYLMAEQAIKPVKEAYEAQKVFIANASHEIKTPLAAITANLEAAEITDNKWINNVEKETEKLTALNTELLNLARTDLVKESRVSEVNLKREIAQAISRLEPRLGGIKLALNNQAPEKVKIATEDLMQIFWILMDNAIKYCDKEIHVDALPHEIVVENDGVQLNEAEAKKVFDRFYQVDKSADGVGLGLSIAKSVAERNHWKLTARGGEMTKFSISF